MLNKHPKLEIQASMHFTQSLVPAGTEPGPGSVT